MGGRADTHVTALALSEGKLMLNRWYYRQRMEAVFTRTQRPWFVLVDPGSQPAWGGPSGSATVEAVAVALPNAANRTTVTGFREPATDAQTIRRMRNCCSSPAPGGPRNRRMARPMCPTRSG